MTGIAQISNFFVQRIDPVHNHSAWFILSVQNILKFVQLVSTMHFNRIFLNHLAKIVFNFVRLKKLHLCN
jgi:hypothetical protein